MDHPKALALALAALLATGGCASLRWSVAKTLRNPGVRIEAFPEVVWEEYDCDHQRRPFFIMESNELVPPRVKPAKDFNHRMVYSMCPARPTEVVAGTLSTRIRFKGRAIVRDQVEAYELRPGRWVVDAFVTLPEDAEPGVYAYEVDFESRSVRFDERLTFVVDGP